MGTIIVTKNKKCLRCDRPFAARGEIQDGRFRAIEHICVICWGSISNPEGVKIADGKSGTRYRRKCSNGKGRTRQADECG